jgi:hypothetical protein
MSEMKVLFDGIDDLIKMLTEVSPTNEDEKVKKLTGMVRSNNLMICVRLLKWLYRNK